MHNIFASENYLEQKYRQQATQQLLLRKLGRFALKETKSVIPIYISFKRLEYKTRLEHPSEVFSRIACFAEELYKETIGTDDEWGENQSVKRSM